MASSSGARVGGGGGSNRENTAKAIVADQISQTVQYTSNLLRLIQQSSLSQAQLGKLPKNLLDRTTTIRNTGQVLEQLPRVVSSLDEHMESALRTVPNLKTVRQLLDNMENNQLQFLSRIHPSRADPSNKNMVNCDKKLKNILSGKPRVELTELPGLINTFPKSPSNSIQEFVFFS